MNKAVALGEHGLQDQGSLIDVIQISELVWTTNTILVESRNIEEAIKLVIEALCLYTGWAMSFAHVYDSDEQSWSIHEASYMCPINILNELEKKSFFTPSVHTPVWPDVQVYSFEKNLEYMRVLIPLSHGEEILGYLEFIAKEEEVDSYQRGVFNQIGRQLGLRLHAHQHNQEFHV